MNRKALIFGYGSAGRRHLNVLKKHFPKIEITIFTNKQNKSINSISNYTKIKELNPDFFIVANETENHLKILTYLEANFRNKNILIEKPLFHKINKINKLKNYVYINYNLRFHPLILKIKSLIKNKKILLAQIICNSYLPNWRPGQNYKNSYSAKAIGGGVLLDLSHELDYIKFLFGNYLPIQAVNKKISNLDISSDDLLILTGKFNKNSYFNLILTYFGRIPKREIIIETSDISIKCCLLTNELIVVRPKSKKIIKLKKNFSTNDMFHKVHKSILENKNKKIVCNFEDGYSLLKTLEKIKKIKLS